MKKLYVLALVILVTIGFVACNKEQPAPGKEEVKTKQIKHYTVEQFMNVTSFRGASFTHDEKKILFSSDQSGIFNIYSVTAADGTIEPLTTSTKESYLLQAAFPADNRILFSADSGGNEISHIFLRNEDGVITDLTPEPQARAEFYGWSYDLKSFFYASNKRDPKFMDLYEMEIAGFKSSLFYKNDQGFENFTISNDKMFIACGKVNSSNDSDIYLFDRAKGELKNITAHEGEMQNNAQQFDVASKKLYFLCNAGSEFTYIKSYELATGKSEKILEKNWDILGVGFSREGTYRTVIINNDGRTEVEFFNTVKNEPVQLPAFQASHFYPAAFSRSETQIAFYLSDSDSPNNLYVYDFRNGSYKKLTESMNPEIDKEDLVKAEVIRYKSFDGLEIPAVFYKPKNITPGEKVPALVSVHGGPGGQARPTYRDSVQYLVNHGYAVLDVNNRGSSGYGKTFFKLDDLKHGEDDLADCVEAKKFLAATGFVDENKIGIIGGSYGGYMVLAALAFRPEEFAVGVDIFGVANWLRTLKSIPPWWESFRIALYKEMGDPNTDEEYLKKISPLFHADQITKPLIVLQGANDPRVLKAESDEIVEAVKKKGVPVEYVIYEDEGHGFRKRKNQIDSNKAILEFLDKYLKGKKETYIY